jgi:uncharacterized membrane protein YccC
MARFVVFLILFCAAVPVAQAQQAKTAYGKIVVQRWAAMDKCEAAAHKAFPDYTAASNAKREAKLKECLASQLLPEREAPATGR